MVELLSKCIKQPETNAEMYAFVENTLVILDQTPLTVTANLPLHFALQLAAQLGFRLEDNYTADCAVLDLQEGRFTPGYPEHQLYLDGKLSETTFDLLQTNSPVTLYRLKLNQLIRRQLLQAYEQFFVYHISDFGHLKTVKVLEEVLG
jgi:DNA repair protein RecO (recombination protein O)